MYNTNALRLYIYQCFKVYFINLLINIVIKMAKSKYSKYLKSLEEQDINNVVENKVDNNVVDTDDDLKKYDWEGLGPCQYLYDHPEVLGPDELENDKSSKRDNKNDILYNRLGRPQGITLDELQNELGWEQKSIRGNISNIQKKRQFTLVTISVLSPDLDKGGFKKDIYYMRKDAEFDIKNDFFKKLVDEQA